MTNKQLLDIWYNDITKQPFKKSINTRDTYMKQINYFLDFTNKNILDINKKDVKLYLQSLNVSDNTYNLSLASIKSLYSILSYDARVEDLINIDPTFGVKSIQNVKHKEKTPLTREEQQLMLLNAKNKRDYAVLLTLLTTGMRIHELINLTLEQYLNRKDNVINLVVTKGSKERNIFLNNNTIEAIDEYLEIRKDGCDKLFTSNGSKPLDRSCCGRTLRNIARRAGFSEERVGQICNHLTRHSLITSLVNNGVDVAIVQQIAGHSSSVTTLNFYTKVDKNNVKDTMVEYSI